MTLAMLSRQQLEIINRKTHVYPLHIAEKDYFLAIAIHAISNSPLKNILVFKGGTCLHHCFLDQYRFSEDLDFSTNSTPIDIKSLISVFKTYAQFSVKKEYVSPATLKIEKLQYLGPLGLPNSLKIEVDYLQNVLLKPALRSYRNVWGIDSNIMTMDIREISAEKIRAMSDRARYRDFYDQYLILHKFKFDIHEIIDIVKQKEIRIPITKSNIMNNWEIIKTQQKQEMDQIYYSHKVSNEQVEEMLSNITFDEIKQFSHLTI